jgi:6-phosphogluconolactonase
MRKRNGLVGPANCPADWTQRSIWAVAAAQTASRPTAAMTRVAIKKELSVSRIRSSIALSVAAVATTAVSLGVAPGAQADSSVAPAPGAVYVLGNQVAGNAVLVYDRAADGTLTAAGAYPTGGAGTGGGLGSQNAVVVDQTAEHVYAVNAGSDSISSFAVTETGLRLLSTVPSGGALPISVSVRGNRLYALNAASGGNITGFLVDNGRLTRLPGSTRALSGTATAPAQVSISPDGDEVVVTEKATQLIDVFRLNSLGWPVSRTSVRSQGATPFGFDFTGSGDLAVSEAGPSALSTYDVRPTGLRTVSSSVGNNEAAACWVVVTDDGRFVYTGNGGGSQSISSYRVGKDSSVSLLDGESGVAAGGVSDIALSSGSGFLYSRLGNGTVGAFAVNHDGSLTSLPVAAGLPAGAAGIAAR